MANGEDKTSSKDFYGVLGLKKECSASELRNSYKKLALRWHPDRCSASGNTKYVEEAKNKFQAIQQAYSVLSDDNKRFLYDVGLYDSEDEDEEYGMGDFMNEMVAMMSQTKPNENEEESFSELQELFEDMCQEDIGSFGTTFQTSTSCSSSSSCASYSESPNSNNRRVSSDKNSGKTKVGGSSGFESHFQKFCLGVEHQQEFKRGKGVRGGVQVQGEGSGSSSSSRWKQQAMQKTKGLIRNMDVSSN